MNDLTADQRDARLQDARSTLLRSLERIDQALEEAHREATESAEGLNGTTRGEAYVEAVLVLWLVRWPDCIIDPAQDVRIELSGGFTSTCSPRVVLQGMVERARAGWLNQVEVDEREEDDADGDES